MQRISRDAESSNNDKEFIIDKVRSYVFWLSLEKGAEQSFHATPKELLIPRSNSSLLILDLMFQNFEAQNTVATWCYQHNLPVTYQKLRTPNTTQMLFSLHRWQMWIQLNMSDSDVGTLLIQLKCSRSSANEQSGAVWIQDISGFIESLCIE